MKKSIKTAPCLAPFTFLMGGGMSVEVTPAIYHIARLTFEVWKRMRREADTNKLELHYQPTYSPELNPDEHLNDDLKTTLNRGIPARGNSKLKDQFCCA